MTSQSIAKVQTINHAVASVSIPGSKSYTLRALLMAAMSDRPVTITGVLMSGDTQAAINCLRCLGVDIQQDKEKITVKASINVAPESTTQLHVNQSGVTMRLLTAICCTLPGAQVIGGIASLNARPIGVLVDSLRSLGAHIHYLDKEGYPPVSIGPAKLHGGKITIDGSTSSQYVTATLLIAPLLKEGITLQIVGQPTSEPYIDMTIECMHRFGIQVKRIAHGAIIPGSQYYASAKYHVEGDVSSAAYFWAIAALTQSTITTTNIVQSSIQPDMALLDILANMGNVVTKNHSSTTVKGTGVHAVDIDMTSCPDQIMTVAVLAAFASGKTTISGIRTLRIKESDRVSAIINGLQKMGITANAANNVLTINGGSPHAARIATYDDHRIAMAFAVAGTRLDGMIIENPSVVNKTFPSFWDELEAITTKEQ